MARRRDGFHRLWDGVIGPVAAELRYTTWVARLFGAVSAFVAVVVAIVDGSVRSVAHTVLTTVWVALLAHAVAWFVVWTRRRSLQYAAASRFLGLDIRASNFPPSSPRGFEKWCDRHGVVPPAARHSTAAN